MITDSPVAIHWFRRDLRLTDNASLYHALKSGLPVVPVFIFDKNILDKLSDRNDKRVQFIHAELGRLNEELKVHGSAVHVFYGKPEEVWSQILTNYNVRQIHTNRDYEPYALERDAAIEALAKSKGAGFSTYKDHVVFEYNEVLKEDGKPYTVFTPYSRKWRAKLNPFYYKAYPTQNYFAAFAKQLHTNLPSLESMGFASSEVEFPARIVKNDIVSKYDKQRDFPAINGTSRLGIHLRFGTLSVRQLLAYALNRNQTFVNELIWRDFYQQILAHFPHVATEAFKPAYNRIAWRNNEDDFKRWCAGETGYPLVDAGMRELNATGYMHNRVRMVVASFLTKHLLIDWRWGEAYFAEKLLDFDLAANNGGWQWAAGSGTDAAPYFRVFNPALQMQKFDPDKVYVRKWVPEYGTSSYSEPVVDHEIARKRCLETYQAAVGKPQ